MLKVRRPSALLRSVAFPTCQTRGGGPRPPPRSLTAPAAGDTRVPNSGTAPATPGRARPSRGGYPEAPGAPRTRGEGAPGGRVPPRGGAWGGARGVLSVEGTWGRPLGFVCNPGSGPQPLGGEGARDCGAAAPTRGPAPVSSPGLRAAAAASRALRPRLGSAGLGAATRSTPRPRRARRGRGREEPPGPGWSATPPRAARGLAAAAGNPGAEPPSARPRRLGPARVRAGRWEPAETKVAARLAGRGGGEEKKGEEAAARGSGAGPGAVEGGRGPARKGETCRASERERLRGNFAPVRGAPLRPFSPRRLRHPRAGRTRGQRSHCLARRGDCRAAAESWKVPQARGTPRVPPRGLASVPGLLPLHQLPGGGCGLIRVTAHSGNPLPHPPLH